MKTIIPNTLDYCKPLLNTAIHRAGISCYSTGDALFDARQIACQTLKRADVVLPV
jgi:hypothetical protein